MNFNMNLQTMNLLRALPNSTFPSNVIWFHAQQQDAPATARRLRPRPPAAIREKAISTADHEYHQCLSVKETARLLAVSIVTIHRMLKDGRLHGIRNGRLIRVAQWSLDQYLIANTTVPDNHDPIQPTSKPKRIIKSTSHQVAMLELERLGI